MYTEDIRSDDPLPEVDRPETDRLEVDKVICEKGFNLLFKEISFTAQQGSVIRLNGANGSGKTTLLRSIAGLHQPEHGEIRWNTVNIKEDDCKLNQQLNYLGHKQGLNADLTPLENLRFISTVNHDSSNMRQKIPVEEALEIVGANRFSHIPTQMLSAGQKQRVAMARLIINPLKVWLLDEPATALDKAGIELLESLMTTHLDSWGIIIYTSHQPLNPGSRSLTEVKLIR